MSKTITYDKELLISGEEKFKHIQAKMKDIQTNLEKYEEKMKQIERMSPQILYEGEVYEFFKKAKTFLENIVTKLETSDVIIHRAKGIVERYNDGDFDKTTAVFLLENLHNTYLNSFHPDYLVGTALDEKFDYSNIYDDDFIPQGMTILGSSIIISAYSHNKNSRLYIYSLSDPKQFYTVVLNNKNHVGGVTYDSKNHVLLVTGKNGKINAYNYDAMNEIAKTAQKGSYSKNIILDLSSSENMKQSIELKCDINMNYRELDNGNKHTNYQAASVYYDNQSNAIFISRFSKNDGKLVSGNVSFDAEKGSYKLANPKMIDISSGVQGISTYHRDDKTYLVESRSYGYNRTQITVRDITSGNNTVVGTKTLNQAYGEGIQVDSAGKANIIFESGSFAHHDNLGIVDIDEIINENNQKTGKINIVTNKYEKGNPIEGGYPNN